MSLFKWSTPERRDVNSHILPIIPNEIYFEIFEHIASSTEILTEEQIQIFTCLSPVCRLFANFCLPRVFEQVEFSGSVFCDDTSVAVHGDTVRYRTSRGSTLCAQLAAKQPLALALAQKVKVCRYSNWNIDGHGAWAVRVFANKCLAGMVHMKHLRQLFFSDSYVDAEHWTAIATLRALEDLSFHRCRFLLGPADNEPDNSVQLKVSCLRVTRCYGNRQPFGAVDVQHLRTLITDFPALVHIDWLPQSALTEIRIHHVSSCQLGNWLAQRVHDLLMRAPKSVEALWLPLSIEAGSPRDILKSIFNDPDRKFPPHLRSLTLQLVSEFPLDSLPLILDGVGLVTGLQSLRIKVEHQRSFWRISHAEIRHILHESLGVASSLRWIDIDDKAFCFMNGEWSESSCHAM